MTLAPIPDNDSQRLATLDKLEILSSENNDRFDRITRVAAALFDVPIAMVNLITESEHVNKACTGFPAGGHSPRSTSFCSFAIMSDEPFVIPDMLKDERFIDNPSVTGGAMIRSYAGVPLTATDGTHPGTLCLMDTKPRKFTAEQISLLEDLAAWVEIEFNSIKLLAAFESFDD